MFDEIWEKIRDFNDHYAISKNELEFIVNMTNKIPIQPVLLELGVCHGRTLAALALIAMRKAGVAVGIDFFQLEGSASEVRSEFQKRNVTNYVILEENTHTAPWESAIDFLVVDAGHDEANVKPDIDKYLPFVTSGGYVAFDDYDDPFNRESAHWAVRYYADLACKDWIDLGIVEGVRIWQRP